MDTGGRDGESSVYCDWIKVDGLGSVVVMENGY